MPPRRELDRKNRENNYQLNTVENTFRTTEYTNGSKTNSYGTISDRTVISEAQYSEFHKDGRVLKQLHMVLIDL